MSKDTVRKNTAQIFEELRGRIAELDANVYSLLERTAVLEGKSLACVPNLVDQVSAPSGAAEPSIETNLSMNAFKAIAMLPNILLNVGASNLDILRAQTPMHYDGDGNWTPPTGQSWEEIPLNDVGKPNWTDHRWDPWSPQVPEDGKVIIEDCDNFRVLCHGMTYEVPWDDLCPPAPSEPRDRPPRGNCSYGARTTERTVNLVEKHMYIRKTEQCFMQVTCVKQYMIRERQWVCDGTRTEYPNGTTRGSNWNRRNWEERTVFVRRTTYFSCT